MDILKSICNVYNVTHNVIHALNNLIIALVVMNKQIENNRKIHAFVWMAISKMKLKSVGRAIPMRVKLIRIANIKTVLIIFGPKEKIVMMVIMNLETVALIAKLIKIILVSIPYLNHHFALNVVIIVENVK